MQARLIPPLLTIRYYLVLLCFSISIAHGNVTISGLEGLAKDNVRILLPLSNEKCDSPRWRIEQLFAQSEQSIDPALRAVGFYHPTIQKSLAFTNNCWQANYIIQSGPQTMVKSISLVINGEARDDSEFQKLRARLMARTGQALRHDNYERMRNQISALAAQRGYLHSEFTSQKLLIDKKNNAAHFEWVFNSGVRQKFGEITVVQDVLDPDFVARFISLKKGEYYSSEQIVATHNALSRSGYFNNVAIRPTIGESGQPVPITITLEPRPTHRYTVGVGFDTNIGMLFSATYRNNRINQYGHFLTADMDIAPVLSTVNVEYNIPLDKPLTDSISAGAGLKREANNSFRSKMAKVSSRYRYAFDNGWRQTLSLDYVYEDFKIGALTQEHALLLIPGGSWLYSVSNNSMRPTVGYKVRFDIAGSYNLQPISDVTFVQSTIAATMIHSLPWADGLFIGRFEQGATLTNQFNRLSTTYRYYAGGLNSVRGYSFKELGPKDVEGNVIGGQYLTTISAEYEHALFENWGVAAFMDMGNAYNSLNSMQLKKGAGIGARWYSPFGPVRVDFALPLDPANSSFQIHFSAGARL